MKKWIFVLVLFFLIGSSGAGKACAGGTGILRCLITESSEDAFTVKYYFEFDNITFSEGKKAKFSVYDASYAGDTYYFYVEPSEAELTGEQDSSGDPLYCLSGSFEVPFAYKESIQIRLTYYYDEGNALNQSYTVVGLKSKEDAGPAVSFSGEYTVEYYEPGYSSIAPSGGYVYTFTTSATAADSGSYIEFDYDSYIKYSHDSDEVNLMQLRDNKVKESHISQGCTFVNYYVFSSLLDDASDALFCDLYYTVNSSQELFFTKVFYNLAGDVPEPTPTSTPKPTPTNTPKPTPTSTPKPTPTSTLTPKPTSTPTPSPTPAPKLVLNAYLDGGDQAVAEYETGGCSPVKSVIALYEVPDINSFSGSVIEQKVFLSGAGSMSELVIEGKLYRYKLTYTFVRDGVQYTEYIWSDVLQYVDDEWESGYIATGRIETFRELMFYIWNDLLTLPLKVENKFSFSIKAFFLWTMIAGGLVVVIYKLFFDK